MSIFLLITVIMAAWVCGLHSCLLFQRRGGFFYPLSLMAVSIVTGILLVGYVATH